MSSYELSEFRQEDHSMDISSSPIQEHRWPTATSPSTLPSDYESFKDDNDTSSVSSATSAHQFRRGMTVSELEFRQPILAERQPVEIAQAKWYRGWQTILFMTILYLLALGVAIGQYILYRYLDGKAASNVNETVDTTFCFLNKHCTTGPYTSQQYVTSASVVFSNVFEYLLQIALAFASTQYLWKILRTTALSIETIEALFCLRSNPLNFFSLSVFRHGFILVLMAVVIYSIPLAASFPPGSLTVKSTYPNIPGFAIIPTFNASDPGNGTIADLTAVSFLDLGVKDYETTGDGSSWSATIGSAFFLTPGPLRQLAASTILAGKFHSIPSPCGPNCTYTYEIEGPTLKCSQEEVNLTTNLLDSVNFSDPKQFTFYSASWFYYEIDINEIDSTKGFKNASGPIYLNISVVNIPQIPYSTAPNDSAEILLTEMRLSCVPYRSQYTIINSYMNNVQELNYTTTEIELLPHVESGVNISGTVVSNSLATFLQGEIQWTNETLSWFRDVQLLGIVNGMATALNGSLTTIIDSTPDPTAPPNTDLFLYWSSAAVAGTGTGGPLIPFTPLSNTFDSYTFPVSSIFDPPINLTITEDMLNKILGDYVISLIPAFSAWNQSVPVTRFPSHNIYWFSSPKQLIIPYTLCLSLSLIVILLGIYALHKNGIPAIDGGFLQLFSTSQGSERLRKAGAANGLGGDGGEVPKKIKKLKIKYGELVGLQVEVGGHLVRRAGFGMEDEIIPLIKGEKYGVVGGI